MYINEYLRQRGNLEEEPVVKPKQDLIKIIGDPKQTFGENPSSQRNKKYIRKDEIKKREERKQMLYYPKYLVLVNREEKGKEEVKLKLPDER